MVRVRVLNVGVGEGQGTAETRSLAWPRKGSGPENNEPHSVIASFAAASCGRVWVGRESGSAPAVPNTPTQAACVVVIEGSGARA